MGSGAGVFLKVVNKMTVDKVIPCVCTYPGDQEEGMESDYGMPQLVVINGLASHLQFYSAYCPRCGRGSKQSDFKSAYLALKHWNTLQRFLWEMEEKGPGYLFAE